MSTHIELMPREFAGSMPEMMAEYLRAIELLRRVLAEVPQIGNSSLASEIRAATAHATCANALSPTRLSS